MCNNKAHDITTGFSVCPDCGGWTFTPVVLAKPPGKAEG